jgi:glutathione S-transferase
MIRLTAFRWVPPFAQGLVRDLRVRWALEEAGLAYEEKLIGPDDQRAADYRRLQPFGQVPALEDDGLVLFESGAIVLHIAEKSPALLPADSTMRARARTWAFAALNSIEPHVQNLAEIDLFNANQDWAKARRPAVLARLTTRLKDLAVALGEREYLEGQFSAGDLLMTTVLRILRHTDLLRSEFPALDAYRVRCEARPAFGRALAAQMEPFAANEPKAQSA